MTDANVWIPGSLPDIPGPLQRFLPVVPKGVISNWLTANVNPGSLILDPFGSTPLPAVEAARAGYRVLVAANNPVARFLLDMAADPPAEIELKSALAELSRAMKGSERLPQHISNLYKTECAHCGATITAEAFLWERGANAPYARVYTCEKCGDSGEHPALDSDVERARAHQKHNLTWSRALERVAPLNDPDREHVEEALEAYLPRAVYALMTLVNAIDLVAPSPAATAERAAWIYRQRSIIALLLSACDRGNCLWPIGGSRTRPRQLTRLGRFIEFNLWKVLEESATQWSTEASGGGQVPLVLWPQLPPAEGGITVFDGRIRELIEQLSTQPVNAMISAIPRPNQAFWSLSALWSGWLWGREASAPFKSVLRRRRYDWAWHTTALCSALQNIESCLLDDSPFFTLVSEVEAGYLTALFIAAGLSGFDLLGLALRPESNQLQAHWAIQSSAVHSTMDGNQAGTLPSSQKIQDAAVSASLKYLRERAEPAGISAIHTAALINAQDMIGAFPREPNQAAELYTSLHNGMQQAYLNRSEFQRFGGSEGSLEGGKWWIGGSKLNQFSDPAILPIADRVEMELMRAFHRQQTWEFSALDHHLCAVFPGLDTPDMSLIRACLESYATEENPGVWTLRTGESTAGRRNDLGEMRELLDQVMARAGLTTQTPVVRLPEGQFGLIYENPEGVAVYQFQIMVSAVLGLVMNSQIKAIRGAYILYPGSRAVLMDYKIHNNPVLNHQI
ncbi:MAG TPA: hypothetical protein VN363_03270, partial [Anaerolineales bacterium]|nr:hypothetical protein [Anaerolineales bacterium]